MQTILGAGGAVGTLLAKELSNYTDKIRLVNRNPISVNGNEELFKADLTNPDEVMIAVEGSEIVYVTIAFEYKLKVWEQKWVPFINSVINACIKHKAKLVFFDNIYMYDKNFLTNMKEDTPINPPSKKGEVRYRVLNTIMNKVKSGELTALIARAPDFVGTSSSILIETVYNNFKKGKKAIWLGDADKIHDFIYIPDAAKGTAMLGNTPDAYNQVWHLPTGNPNLTGKNWMALFAKEMNIELKYSVMPKWTLGILGIFIPILRELKEMVYQLDRDYIFNSDKFCKKFDFKPTSPKEIVKNIVRELAV